MVSDVAMRRAGLRHEYWWDLEGKCACYSLLRSSSVELQVVLRSILSHEVRSLGDDSEKVSPESSRRALIEGNAQCHR